MRGAAPHVPAMPYHWTDDQENQTRVLTAWPHRSLPRKGFAIFIGATWAMLMVPALTALGSKVLWVLLPFLVGTLGLIWFFLERTYRSGQQYEELRLTRDLANLTRHDPGKPDRSWQANPHWVELDMIPTKGPVENYLTLRGAGRTVELGAFLTAEERHALYDELRAILNGLRAPQA